MRIKRGDTKPDLELALTTAGEPVDVSEAESVRIVGVQGGTQAIDDTAPNLEAAADGVVRHEWEAGETDDVGRIFVVVLVDWGEGGLQSFPEFGTFAVDIGDTEIVEEES